MRYSYATVVCSVLAVLCGCTPVGQWFFGVSADGIKADRFANDPLVKRLAIAVDRGDEAGVAAAVAQGASVNSRGKDGFCLLCWAVARNNPKGFEALLKHGADLYADCRDLMYLPDASYSRSVLQQALASENPQCLKAALRQGLSPDHVPYPKDGMTLILFAAWIGSMPAIETLLEAGADINRRDSSGYTPLVNAMMRRDYNTAWFLLQRGADPIIKDDRGNEFTDFLKEYGSRGVGPDSSKSFEQIVSELVRRGLLTRQDIVEADKPKTSGKPGVEIIYHEPGSEVGQAIRAMDRAKQEATRRGNK